MQVLYIFAYKNIFDIFLQNEKTNWMKFAFSDMNINYKKYLIISLIMYKNNEYSRVMNIDGFD